VCSGGSRFPRWREGRRAPARRRRLSAGSLDLSRPRLSSVPSP